MSWEYSEFNCNEMFYKKRDLVLIKYSATKMEIFSRLDLLWRERFMHINKLYLKFRLSIYYHVYQFFRTYILIIRVFFRYGRQEYIIRSKFFFCNCSCLEISEKKKLFSNMIFVVYLDSYTHVNSRRKIIESLFWSQIFVFPKQRTF